MADTLKVLAQTNPGASSLTDAYTVAASTTVMVNTLTIANRSAVATSYRVTVAVAGAADDPKHYLFYDVPIMGNCTHCYHLGVTLATTEKIRVWATLATLTFNFFGVEIT